MRNFLVICALLIASLGYAEAAKANCSTATGDRGIALLIGNGAYDDLNWPILANAVNDIDHVCKAFAKAGFQIIDIRDASIAELNSAAVNFEARAARADSAIVYYAGHGFEYNGRNFMVPVDAPLFASKGELDTLFLPLEKLLNAASKAKNFNLFFMDACRTPDPVVQLKDLEADDPAGSVSPMGLLEMKQGAVFYSTAKGRPALDAAPVDAKISPFANAIAAKLAIPGLELSDYFKVVSRDVYAKTNGMNFGPQQPFHYGSWFEDFYLNGPVNVSSDEIQAKIAANADAQKRVDGSNKPNRKSRRRSGPTVLAYQYIPPTVTQTLQYLNIERMAVEDEPIIVAEILENHGVADITLAAATGNPVAQYLLGYMYHFGVGVRSDHETAIQWLEKSAAQDHPAGLTELAYFLQENRPDQKARALELYERASALGFSKAKSHLGFSLWSGNLGVTDGPRAIGLFKEASEEGHPYATFAWGLYGNRQEEAKLRLAKLAEAGNLEGNNWLCELDYIGHNLADLQENCGIAARGGYSGARAILADLYERGAGVGQSHKEAVFWAKLALQQPEFKTRKSLFRKTENIVSEH